MKNPWIRLSMNAWSLAFEASTVIGLRAMKLAAGGPAAERETEKMVQEKIDAGISLQGKAMTGALGFTAPSVAGKTLAHYRRKVRANRRRLMGG
jgi:hypothetical protein